MKIESLNPFILHVPVTGDGIADSTHQITHWGAPGVVIRADDGLCGYGYTGTHGHLATDRLIVDCVAGAYAPLLIGEDPSDVEGLWSMLCHHPPIQWVGRCGITHLALSAVDIALWDLKAKAAGVPLWRLLRGDPEKRVEAYNTDGGWLNWSLERLVEDARCYVEDKKFRGVKIKVGSDDLDRDLDRVEAVRRAIGPRTKLMVDANGKWDMATALRADRRLRQLDVYWMEEPLWYDDLGGHAKLAQETRTPIALGEQLYGLDHFRSFIDAGAVWFVQPDVVRLGGITEWRRVAHLALERGLPIAPHVGDMMQVHLHLAIAHGSCDILEHVPWMRGCFEEPATVEEGYFVIPEKPGASTTLREDAMEEFNVL